MSRADRWRRAGQAAGLVAGSLLFVALALELALRAAPELFGPHLANQLFSPYTTKPGGLYFREPTSDVLFMHPGFETRAYFNGYTWHHASDARGFRNPPGRPVDGVLLLGDSLVYGHGVEESEGVAAALEREHGRTVYNLSRQGDSLYQHYVLLRLHLDAFRPDAVVLFVFHNDFLDLLAYRGLDALERAPELARDDYPELRRALAGREAEPHTWARRLRYRSLGYRLFLALRSRLQRGAPVAASAGDPLDAPLLDPVSLSVLTRYYARVLGDLTTRCEAVDARLLVVHLDAYPAESDATRTAKARARRLLASAAGRHGIPFFDTGDRLTACEACTLPRDGHLTAEGHRRLAAFVDAALGEEPPRRDR